MKLNFIRNCFKYISQAELRLFIISGIPADDSGTGRFISHVAQCLSQLPKNQIKLICRPASPRNDLTSLLDRSKYGRFLGYIFNYIYCWFKFGLSITNILIQRNKALVLLHPQSIGYRLSCLITIGRVKPPLVYLLDSSFFCLSSYNNLNEESNPCFRCLKVGSAEAIKNKCKPFPRLGWPAIRFTSYLKKMVKSGCIKVVAQNFRQAELAQRHFELESLPRVIGLWTKDFDQLLDRKKWINSIGELSTYSWDVLFHGHCLKSKGANWLAKVAVQCPDLLFMFPFSKPDLFEAPENCSFVPCSWENGLQHEMKKARIIVVPSLWSAPIEGALIKSIVFADAVAVVSNSTGFSDELPPGLILKLSTNPLTAADELRQACADGWRPDFDLKKNWVNTFVKIRDSFIEDMISTATADD